MLLFVDGAQGGGVSTKWDSASSGTRATATPRFTGAAHYHSAVLYKTIAGATEVFLSGAFWFASGAHAVFSVYGDSGVTQHLTLVRNASLKLELRRGSSGSGTVIATGTTNVATSAWVQIEARFLISDTVGVCQVRINGSASNEINFSGDTKNGGTATTIDKVAFIATNSSCKVTDTAVANTAGSINNTWLGDCRVLTLSPTGSGHYSDGTGSDSDQVDNWAHVDELPFNSADQLELPPNAIDTFTFSNLAAGTPGALGLQVCALITKISAPAQTFKWLIRTAGTDYRGSAVSPTTSFTTVSQLIELNPATSTAWTYTAVDALEAGIEVGTGVDPLDLGAISIEALVESFPTVNLVKVFAAGVIIVGVPNDVVVVGAGAVLVEVAAQVAGAITVAGTGAVDAGSAVTDFPRPEPADPTLVEPDHDLEPVIERVSLEWPAPTLVDGVPVDWVPL